MVGIRDDYDRRLVKDADGLDRVRLGDLDPRYLRHPEARVMVPFAQELFETTDGVVATGVRTSSRFLEAACRLQARNRSAGQHARSASRHRDPRRSYSRLLAHDRAIWTNSASTSGQSCKVAGSKSAPFGQMSV